MGVRTKRSYVSTSPPIITRKKTKNNNKTKTTNSGSSPAAGALASATSDNSTVVNQDSAKSLDAQKSGKVKPIFVDESAKLVISHLEKLNLDSLPVVSTSKRDANKQTILCATVADKLKVMEALSTLNVPLNSFTEQSDKPLIFKLSGVPADDQSEITNLLKKTGLAPLRVTFLMRPRPVTGKPTPTPIFLVSFEKNSTDLKTLRFKHNRAGMQSLSWDIFKSTNRRTTQCHRCQAWGHAESNCRRPPKCFKCAEDHHTSTCVKPISLLTQIVCANCKGDHAANSRDCPTRLKFEKAKESLIAKKRPQRPLQQQQLQQQQQPRHFEPQIGNAWELRQAAINNLTDFPPLNDPIKLQNECGHPPGSNASVQEPLQDSRQKPEDRSNHSDYHRHSNAKNNNMIQAPTKHPVSFAFGNSQLSSVPTNCPPLPPFPPMDELRSLMRELREGLQLLNQVKEMLPVLQALRKDAPRYLNFYTQDLLNQNSLTDSTSTNSQTTTAINVMDFCDESETKNSEKNPPRPPNSNENV